MTGQAHAHTDEDVARFHVPKPDPGPVCCLGYHCGSRSTCDRYFEHLDDDQQQDPDRIKNCDPRTRPLHRMRPVDLAAPISPADPG
jgi:hypothetical protein